MTAGIDLGDVYRAIGALEAQGRILLQRSAEHDAETKEIRAGISGLQGDVTDIKRDLATAMPVVQEVKNWKQRAIGLGLVGGLFGGGLLAQIKGWIG